MPPHTSSVAQAPPQTAEEEEDECRICRGSGGELWRPCRCSSVVHTSCLWRWEATRTASEHFPELHPVSHASCEVCLSPYTAKPPAHARVRCWPCTPSLELCLGLILGVIGLIGHALYIRALRSLVRPPARTRVALASANAAVTLALLALIQRAVSRWLRERDVWAAVAAFDVESATTTTAATANSTTTTASASTSTSTTAQGGSSLSQTARTAREGGGVAGHVALGATLSIVAAAEVFVLMQSGGMF